MRKEISDLTLEQRQELAALAALPDDRIDTTDAPEAKDWSQAKRGVFYRPGTPQESPAGSEPACPATPGTTAMARLNVPDRTFFEGDNLAILQGINSESIDLIATDPPFNKRRNMSGRAGKYPDQWYWADGHTHTAACPADCSLRAVQREWLEEIEALGKIAESQKGAPARRDAARYNGLVATIEAARLTHDDGVAAFLCFLSVRLLECHRILKPTGSIYLHCDHSANAYIRMAMDAVFGKDNFRNEIVWLRRQDRHNLGRQQMGRAHDTIFWYAKSRAARYNIQYTPYSDEYIKSAYNKFDHRGQYRTLPCTNETGGNKPYEFRGITRAWRFAPEHMEELYRNDLLVQATPASPFQYKKYLDPNEGVKIQDVWTDVAGARGREHTGWPTQKPVELMRRIIAASSNPGDVVLDPFAGCATTLVACENMGQGLRRRWISIDRAAMAKVHVLNRLLNTDSKNAAVAVHKVPGSDDDGVYDEAEFQKALAANQWAMRLETTPPQRTDAGETAPDFATPYRPTTRPMTTFTYDEMLDMYFARWLYQCAGCGKPAPTYPNGKVDTGDFQLDHLTPRDLNDPDTDQLDNRCALCAKCNRKKSNRLALTGLQIQNVKDKEIYLKRADLPKESAIRAWGRSELAKAKPAAIGPGAC